MVRWKILATLVVLAVCGAAAIAWDSAVQPRVVSAQAFRQMEVHTDGTGDQAAAERWIVTNSLHLPAQVVLGVGALAALLLIWCAGTRAPWTNPTARFAQGDSR